MINLVMNIRKIYLECGLISEPMESELVKRINYH